MKTIEAVINMEFDHGDTIKFYTGPNGVGPGNEHYDGLIGKHHLDRRTYITKTQLHYDPDGIIVAHVNLIGINDESLAMVPACHVPMVPDYQI
jgi:hypothetical protein